MRIPQLAKNTVVYASIPGIEKCLHFFLIPVYTAFITPSEFGAWAFVAATTAFLMIVAPLRLDSAFGFSIRMRTGWKAPVDDVTASSFQGAVILALVVYLLMYPLCVRFELGLQDARVFWALGLLDGWLRLMCHMVLRKLQMQERPRTYLIWSLCRAIVGPTSAFVLVAHMGLGVYGIVLGDLLGCLVIAVPLSLEMIKEIRTRFSMSAFREAIVFSFPLLFHGAASWGLSLLDRILLERLAPLAELGLYDMAARLTAVILLVATGANEAYTPFFFSRYGKEPRKIRLAQIGLVVAFVAMGALWTLMLPVLFRWWVDPQYSSAIGPARILVLDCVLNGVYYLGINYLFLFRKTKLIALCTIVALASNFVANVFLIPFYLSTGAAWASVISRGTAAVLVFAAVAMILRKKSAGSDASATYGKP